MNLQLVVAIAVSSGLLLSSALLPFQTSEIYADESETNTEQELSQENTGSGNSINSNCGENSIDSSASVICGTGIGAGGTPVGAFTVTVRNCFDVAGNNAVRCEIVAPEELAPGPANCFTALFVVGCTFTRDGPTFNCAPRPTVTGPRTQDIVCTS